MDAILARVESCNPALNAIVYPCFEAARARAREADDALRRGESRGPLHGVPVTVKQNVDVAGMPTPNGVRAFESVIAPDDAPVVRNLKAAGAIVIGRTTTPEFSMRVTTDSPLHGRTRNPWHADASSGGSSGGAGAAAAAGMGPLHHGNDIGGSLRIPAFACGVTTVKEGLIYSRGSRGSRKRAMARREATTRWDPASRPTPPAPFSGATRRSPSRPRE
ncbi:MAG: amidase family protein [Burkholderiales bacterium]